MVLSLSSSIGSRIALRHRFVFALLTCVLIACGVAAGMAMVVPADRARAIRLDAIAAALRGPGDAVLTRRVMATPPVMGGDRWLAVPSAQRQLAALLRVDPAEVRLVVASPVGLRRTVTAAAADGTSIRAGYVLSAQDGAAPVTVVPPPSPPPPPSPVVTPPASAPAPQAAEEAPQARPAPVRRRQVRRAPIRPVLVDPAQVPPQAAAPAATVPVIAPAVVPVVRPTPAPSVPLREAVPEVTGTFRAAWRLPAGGWAVVEPRAETVPTAAQQRILLWFLVALAVALPIGWLMAVGLMRPIRRFSEAADHSGRDPAVAIERAPPAELAPVAAAIGRLQGRVQALAADRSAFAGTVRNELSAPLARLRAGLDDAPRQIREAFHDDVADIAEAVAALQLFLTDADAAGELARHDLGELVRRAVAVAVTSGEAVVTETPVAAWVMVDASAIERLLDQLIDHARRAGGTIEMVVSTGPATAILHVRQGDRPVRSGFAPGLYGKVEQGRSALPAGPGLAVARSIARAHGGEVRLVRSDRGMALELRLPLA